MKIRDLARIVDELRDKPDLPVFIEAANFGTAQNECYELDTFRYGGQAVNGEEGLVLAASMHLC